MKLDAARYSTYFHRGRDLLIVTGDSSPLIHELDLHLLTYGISHDPLTRQLLCDGLSAMALYLVSQPRFESFAWTISLQEPRMNLFFSGSAADDTVVGRAFLENVQPRAANLFHSQTSRPRSGIQSSSVDVEGIDIFAMVEQYAAKSDQRPVRFFHRERPPDPTVDALVLSFSDAQGDWFEALDGETVFGLLEDEVSKLLIERDLAFRCGCHRNRILDVVVPLYVSDVEALFGGEERVEVECPRCAAVNSITRQEFLEAASRGDRGRSDRP